MYYVVYTQIVYVNMYRNNHNIYMLHVVKTQEGSLFVNIMPDIQQ